MRVCHGVESSSVPRRVFCALVAMWPGGSAASCRLVVLAGLLLLVLQQEGIDALREQKGQYDRTDRSV